MVHNLTVAIDDDLWRQMKAHSEIRWSVVMKNAAKEKLEALSILEKITQKTILTEDEIQKFSIELGKKVNKR